MKGNDIRTSTLGGTCCSVLASITFGDLLQTIIMAALGTWVSFLMSQWLQSRKKKE